MKRLERPGRKSGFTMIEVTIAASLVALLILAASSLTSTGHDVYGTSQVAQRADLRLQRALQRVVREMSSVGNDVLIPGGTGQFGTHDFTFRQAIGQTDGLIDWGVLQRLAWEPEAGEADDGQDNDGDGLVDEGVLVLVRDLNGPNEQRTVLCTGVLEWMDGETPNGDDDNGNGVVDERGFNVHRTGNVLTIRLAVGAADSEGRRSVQTEETATRLRN